MYIFQACKAVFADENSLREHLKSHLSDLPFRCGLCTFATALRDDLDTHMQVEHPTQLPKPEVKEQQSVGELQKLQEQPPEPQQLQIIHQDQSVSVMF